MLDEKSAIGRAVVIGAGTMGGGIAAQLANAGWQVTLLDVAGAEGADKKARNQAALAGLDRVVKNKPPLLFLPEYASRIQAGNVEDDLDKLRGADWIVEAIAENMDVKRSLLAQIEAHRGPETVVSSNTSGLSLRDMTAGRSPEFLRHFFGTHFLNPPRYLKLLEMVPLPETDRARFDGFVRFAERVLGHRVVEAKDTPGFISTRIWIGHLLDTMHTTIEQGLTIEAADYLTGALLGRPRSATFRMADLVGLDIIAAIAHNQQASLPDDPWNARLRLPDVLANLIANGKTGDKSGAGFYQRDGKNINALDLQTGEYRPRQEVQIPAVETLLALPMPERLAAIAKERAEPWGLFLNALLDSLAAYLETVAPQIADSVLAVDRVMTWGFGWEMGPFAMEDARQANRTAPRNYQGSGGNRTVRVFGLAQPQSLPDDREYISLVELKSAGRTVREIPEASLIDLDDGVVCLEYHTKMNTFNPALSTFVHTAREIAERDFAALVLGNQAAHFSAGYNLNLFLEAMAAENWDAINMMLREVQYAFLGLKYATVPVVAAPHGYTLGAGCEGVLHCRAIQVVPELYMGLPELSVGVVPAGGGTKEMLARVMEDWPADADAFPYVERAFDVIAFPRNSTSADDARKLGFLRAEDGLSRNADRQLYDAKLRALELANADPAPPVKKRIRVTGPDGLARLRMKLHGLLRAGVISAHDHRIADRIAWILTGGDVLYAQEVSEEYLLRLEREVFLDLAREPKSQERMRHTLATGKPLKN